MSRILNEYNIIRRVFLLTMLWMTWSAFAWAAKFAVTSPLDGVGLAAVIAAVTAPISALQAAVFKAYLESRNG